MSDGNFNRALLPATPYQSGMKMGRSIALKQAREALVQILAVQLPNLSAEARKDIVEAFDEAMRSK